MTLFAFERTCQWNCQPYPLQVQVVTSHLSASSKGYRLFSERKHLLGNNSPFFSPLRSLVIALWERSYISLSLSNLARHDFWIDDRCCQLFKNKRKKNQNAMHMITLNLKLCKWSCLSYLKISEHKQCIASSLQSFLKLLDFLYFSSSRNYWSCAGTENTYFTPLL